MQHLDRDTPLDAGVLSLVHRPHASLSDEAFDSVLPLYCLAGLKRHERSYVQRYCKVVLGAAFRGPKGTQKRVAGYPRRPHQRRGLNKGGVRPRLTPSPTLVREMLTERRVRPAWPAR